MKIYTTFSVTDFKTGEQWEEEIEGMGQEAVKAIRQHYAKFSKIVLEGFNVDGKWIPIVWK